MMCVWYTCVGTFHHVYFFGVMFLIIFCSVSCFDLTSVSHGITTSSKLCGSSSSCFECSTSRDTKGGIGHPTQERGFFGEK